MSKHQHTPQSILQDFYNSEAYGSKFINTNIEIRTVKSLNMTRAKAKIHFSNVPCFLLIFIRFIPPSFTFAHHPPFSSNS